MNENAAQTLRQHSYRASPSFAFGVADQSGRGACAPLAIQWAEQFSLIPAHGELILTRWMCTVVIGAVSVDAAGFPTARDTGRGSGSCIAFSGAGVIVLTSQRLVGLVLQGESVLGDVDGQGSRVLVLSVPLADVSVVTLQREARGKERGLMIGTAAGGTLFVDVDRVVDKRNRARRQQKSDGMRTILTAIAEAWRAGVSAQEPDLLQRALDGSWLADGDDLVAPLGRGELPEGVRPLAPTRQAPAPSSSCRACGASLKPEARFCAGCGTPTQASGAAGRPVQTGDAASPPAMCRSCGAPAHRDRHFCGRCGASLAGSTGNS
jgi:hypothetical protein